MNTYPHYKPSGIQWIGEIPEHWGINKIGRTFDIVGSGTTPRAGDDKYYLNGVHNWLLTGDLNDSFIYATSKHITDEALKDHTVLKKYPIDSIVIAMYGATIGKLGILKVETTVNQACCVLSNSQVFDYRIPFYYLLAIRKEIINLSFGGGQPNISQETVKSIKIPIPPLSEQTAIANYLDRKTAEIDQTIADKEALIGLYEEEKKGLINEAVTKGLNPNVQLKDSSIDGGDPRWLGDVPEHWEVKKLKQVSSKIGDGIHATPEYVDSSDFYFINGNNLNEGVITISESTKSVSEEEFEKYKLNLNYGTVLISINGTIGNLAIYQGENIILGKSACYIELLKNLESRHLYYQLQTEFTLNAIETSLSGTTIKNLSLGTVRNLKILLPPLPEQAAIVDYIETETAKINEKMTVARQEIALLKEFRQALIFECVTGKVCCLEEKIDL